MTEINRDRLRRCIAITNGKGGVGKTTSTSHLAGLLALGGMSTLAVDLDPQGNLGEDLGYGNAGLSDEGRGLTRAVQDGAAPEVLAGVRENLDVIPGGKRLNDLVGVLDSRRRRQNPDEVALALAECLSLTEKSYDFILLDCPPGEPQLQEIAMAAAKWVVIPYKSDASSRKGLREVADRVQNAWRVNPDLRLLAVYLYGTGRKSKRIHSLAHQHIREDLGADAPILKSIISHVESPAVDIRERGQLAFELERDAALAPRWYEQLRGDGPVDPGPAATSAGLAEDFRELTQELFRRLAVAEQAVS